MEKINEYEKILGIVDYLKNSDGNLTKEEYDLVLALDDIMQIDKSNAIINRLFHGEVNFKKLLNDIDEEIETTKLLINSTSGLKTKKYIFRKDKLIELKEDINMYFDNQEIDNEDNIQDLITNCLPALKLYYYSLPKFFGSEMIEEKDGKYIINKGIVNKVYDILENTSLVEELRDGIGYRVEEIKQLDIINACREAMSEKDKIYDNKDLIFKYNKLSREFDNIRSELRSKRYKNLDQEIENVCIQLNAIQANKLKRIINRDKELSLKTRLKELTLSRDIRSSYKEKFDTTMVELDSVYSELKRVGLFDYVNKTSKFDFRDSLTNMISCFNHKSDIEGYYRVIEKDMKDANRELRLIRKVKKEYLDSVSREANKLLSNNVSDVKNILEFSDNDKKYKVTPAIALFIIKGLIVVEDSCYADKKITDSEEFNVYKYYKRPMCNYFYDFEDEFKDIKSGNKDKEKTKNKKEN